MATRVRGVYGTPWSKLAGGIPVTKKTLLKLGECLVKSIAAEAKKDFARRGWSGGDPMGGPPIWDSFSYQVRGKSTLEITSTYWGLEQMLEDGGIPSRKLSWLTQGAKNKSPNKYKLTDAEKESRMKKAGRVSKGQRRPLVVPVKTGGGTVVFRTAPLRTSSAWIHPGIAKFTFMERGIKKGRELCAQILGEEVMQALSEGDPFQ